MNAQNTMNEYREPQLISVLIPYYNNEYQILETLESIFNQDYPRIEIVIVDDGSKFFPESDIRKWIQENQPENVEKVIVSSNGTNLGTVKTMANAFEKSNGDIITQIAADDVFASGSVFSDAMRAFDEDEAVEFVFGQLEMWTESLEQKHGDFIEEQYIPLIENCTPEERFQALSKSCFIPAVNFKKRSVRERVGNLTEHYRLIEDWPEHLRVARLGIKIKYVDKVFAKHRDGGISHGNKRYASRTFLYYLEDETNIFKHELLSFSDLLTEAQIRDTKNHLAYCENKYRYESNMISLDKFISERYDTDKLAKAESSIATPIALTAITLLMISSLCHLAKLSIGLSVVTITAISASVAAISMATYLIRTRRGSPLFTVLSFVEKPASYVLLLMSKVFG